MMRTLKINGTAIRTNYNEIGYGDYPMGNGCDKKTMYMKLKKTVLHDGDKYAQYESDKEFFERLVSEGCTYIKFEEVSTAIRGLHDTIAYVKY